jgi:hypothetical protein
VEGDGEWVRVERTSAFKGLSRSKKTFIVPATIFFLVLQVGRIGRRGATRGRRGRDRGGAVRVSDQAVSIIFFVLIIALTLAITAWASRKNKSTSDHYAAGGKISGWQNGLAFSGDYLSAAS